MEYQGSLSTLWPHWGPHGSNTQAIKSLCWTSQMFICGRISSPLLLMLCIMKDLPISIILTKERKSAHNGTRAWWSARRTQLGWVLTCGWISLGPCAFWVWILWPTQFGGVASKGPSKVLYVSKPKPISLQLPAPGNPPRLHSQWLEQLPITQCRRIPQDVQLCASVDRGAKSCTMLGWKGPWTPNFFLQHQGNRCTDRSPWSVLCVTAGTKTGIAWLSHTLSIISQWGEKKIEIIRLIYIHLNWLVCSLNNTTTLKKKK